MSRLADALKSLVNGVEFAVFLFDGEGRFTDYAAGKMKLEVPPEAFLGKRIAEVFPPPLATRFEEARGQTQGGAHVDVTYELPVDRHFVAHFSPLPGDGLVAVLVREITATTRARREVEASEHRFRSLLERSADVLVVLDAERRVTFWSPGSAHALGWAEADVRGKPLLELVHPDDRGLLEARSGEKVMPRLRHRDARWRTIELVVRDLLQDAAVGGLVLNGRDVTEELAFAQRSAEAQKLESIGRLAGGIAHDFNNLLTVILSCGELIQSALEAGQPAHPEDAREILTAANRAKDLTQQLLAFARRQALSPRVVDLSALVCDSERMLRRLLGEDVLLELKVDAQPCTTRCDPAQLQQVVLNLALNARDAMPRGGRLAISTTNVELEPARAVALGLQPGPAVRLRVRDEGAGLSAAARERLFEPFFAAGGRKGGLGLAMVYGIVNQCGGAIVVDSEEGQGATFDLFFARTAEPPYPHVSTPTPAPRPESAVVLVVDDDPGVGGVTERVLSEAGYRVLRAHHGLEALTVAQQEPRLDLLVTDIVMPGLDGRQVAEGVQKQHPAVKASSRGTARRRWCTAARRCRCCSSPSPSRRASCASASRSCSRADQAPFTVTLITFTGVRGRSSPSVGVVSIFFTTS
ncbi:MAG: ATP-binding protein [Myxococcota bacterium]